MKTPKLNAFQKHVLMALNRAGARYLVIGGWAMQALGIDCKTHDLDLWVSHTGYNPNQVHAALHRLAGPSADRMLAPLGEPGKRVTLPTMEKPDIDILTSVGDLDFDLVYSASLELELGSTTVRVPSTEDLIRTKEAAIDSVRERIANGDWAGQALIQAERKMAIDTTDIDRIRAYGKGKGQAS